MKVGDIVILRPRISISANHPSWPWSKVPEDDDQNFLIIGDKECGLSCPQYFFGTECTKRLWLVLVCSPGYFELFEQVLICPADTEVLNESEGNCT